MIDYFKFIKDIADNKLDKFQENGNAQAGNNGPYKHKELPVRNTAHWIITYSYLWRKTRDKKYYNIIEKFYEYINQEMHYGKNGAIKCRNNNGEDKTNGVIGQAWIIEGLVEAYKVLGEKSIINRAKSIFNSQKYNYDNHVWEVIDVDGKVWGEDRTYNHQVWFAASGALLLDIVEDTEIEKQIVDFLNYSNRLMYIHKNGLLYHQANCRLGNVNRAKFFTRKLLCNLSHIFKIKSNSFNILMLEEGYHLFDLYGFALLKSRFGEADIFKSNKLQRAIDYAASNEHINKLFSPSKVDRDSDLRCNKFSFNEYAFGYNSPAFEYPYVAIKLKGKCDDNIMEKLWKAQLKLTFNNETKDFSKNNDDNNTLTARIYELVRYLEVIE